MFSKQNMLILARIAFLIVAIIVSGYLVLKILGILIPFVLGVVYALIMLPVIRLLVNKLRFNRTAATAVTLIVFLALGITILVLISVQLVTETVKFIDNLPGYVNGVTLYVQDLVENSYFDSYFANINQFYQDLPADTKNSLLGTAKEHFPSLIDQAQQFLRKVVSDTTRIVGGIPGTVTIFVISVLAAFFIAKDWENYIKWFTNNMPNFSDKTNRVYAELRKAFGGYVRAQAILVSITGLIVLIWLLVLRVDYALTIAIISIFLDLLPYVGIGLLLIPWTIYLLIIGNYSLAAGLGILYLAITITRQIIEPKILSSSVGTKPLPTLVSLYVGLKVFGVFGLILGPITLVLLNAFHKADVFTDLWKMIKE